MAGLLSRADQEALQREVLGTTRERMQREFCELFEALTQDTPLVLVVEDLHWSDYATLDVLSLLARRTDRARLFVIGKLPAVRCRSAQAPRCPAAAGARHPRVMQ